MEPIELILFVAILGTLGGIAYGIEHLKAEFEDFKKGMKGSSKKKR